MPLNWNSGLARFSTKINYAHDLPTLPIWIWLKSCRLACARASQIFWRQNVSLRHLKCKFLKSVPPFPSFLLFLLHHLAGDRLSRICNPDNPAENVQLEKPINIKCNYHAIECKKVQIFVTKYLKIAKMGLLQQLQDYFFYRFFFDKVQLKIFQIWYCQIKCIKAT